MSGVVVPPGNIRADSQSKVPEIVEATAAGVEEGQQGLKGGEAGVEHLLGV